jgi:deferrochelatase/peroxidase EfeB
MSDELLSPAAKADIQGFVTSGYGHLPHTAYLFIEFRDRLAAQAWLQEQWPHVTSATSWRPQPDAAKAPPPRAFNLAFTAPGLAALGLSTAALNSFPDDFREGMASARRSQILGDSEDSAPDQWELGGPATPPIHLLLILHAATHTDLDGWCKALRDDLARRPGLVEHTALAQSGYRPSHDREPFGFFDAVGQPRIQGIKGEGIRTGEFILGYRNEYNYYPAGPVVPTAHDPHQLLPVPANPYRQDAYRDLGLNGSFVVYRKLQQDVAGFWRFLQRESIRRRGEPDPVFMVWLAAKMVGRWPSGAPLVLAPEAGERNRAPSDDFLYAETDPLGLACPLGAHIRRTNPRDQIRPSGPAESLDMSARHRLLRRGRVYGAPLFDPMLLDYPDLPETRQTLLDLADDDQRRGVHFFSVNASIKRQFEFVQQAWVNNPRFNGLVDNRDPLGGDNDPNAPIPSVMLVPGRPAGLRTAPLPRFITVRGGLYLFMPSLTALRYLATLD